MASTSLRCVGLPTPPLGLAPGRLPDWLERGGVPLDVIPADALAPLRATTAAQHAVNGAAWVTPAQLLDLLAGLRTALRPARPSADRRLVALLAEERAGPNDDSIYVTGFLHQEVMDLMVMTRLAVVRGASRVRLWEQ